MNAQPLAAPRRYWWPAALIPLLALAALAPGVRNGFVHWDDTAYIVENPLLVQPEGLWRICATRESPQYYPLTFSTYWLEYQVWGAWPTGYFLTNLILHAINSLLVFLVVRALGAGRTTAWVVGALFAVHPIQVASVAWLVQRKNVLCGVFFFLTILLYWRYCREAGRSENAATGGQAFYWASLLTFAGALLSKTAAVTLPVSLVLAEWLILRRRGWAPVRRSLPMFLVAAALGVVTIVKEWAIVPDAAIAAPQPLAAAAGPWFYLAKVLWPATLLALYPQWHVSTAALIWWLPAVALVLAVIVGWTARRRLGDLPVWGLGHFLITLTPALGLIPFGYLRAAPVADHFVYLALPGLLLAVVCWLARIVQRWPASGGRTAVVGTVVAVVLVMLGAKTWQQVQIWHDGERLWSHTLADNPDSALAYNNLGVSLAADGRLEDALRCYRDAVRLYPTYWMARTNIGTALRDLGRLDEAAAEFRSMVAVAPGSAVAHFNLARTLVRLGRRSEAFAEYAEAVRLAPTYAEAYANWGVALVEAGAGEEAIERLRAALKLNPDDAMTHFNLGLALAGLGRFEEAEAEYREALRIKPQSPRVYTNLGLLWAAQGRLSDAVHALQAALELDPRDGLAHLNLGVLAVRANRTADAEVQFRAALEIDPNDVEANNNLGALLVLQGRAETAIPYLSEAIRLRPEHANAHYMLGNALAAVGRPGEAIAQYIRATELQPADGEAHEQLAAAYAALGRTAEAVAAATQALELARSVQDEAAVGRITERLAQYRTGTAPTSQATTP